jgi:hypothetical protein
LRTAVDEQARRRITHIELRVVLHGLDEIQLILSESASRCMAGSEIVTKCSVIVVNDN